MNNTLWILLLCIFTSNIYSDKNLILVTSIPKCGTHLVKKLVDLLLLNNNTEWDIIRGSTIIQQSDIDRSKKLLWGHGPANPENLNVFNKNSIKGIFVYRDPRDQMVSFIRWSPPHQNMSFDETFNILLNNCQDAYRYYWEFTPDLFNMKSITDFYNLYLPWRKNLKIYPIKFEHLVGAKGGGSDIIQANAIKNIAKFLGIKLDSKNLLSIKSNLFGNSGTFKEGQIGTWKKYFTAEHKAAFKRVAGKLLIDLGYEKDFNW